MGNDVTPICPGCGCSLVRLGIDPAAAVVYSHNGTTYRFCCDGCVERFLEEPDLYEARVNDLVVCATCLAEKHRSEAVVVEVARIDVAFCGCPHCREAVVVEVALIDVAFCGCPHCREADRRDPERLARRLAA